MFCSVGNGGSMKKVICALVALGVSGSAMAWGDREQGALVGAVIGALIAKDSQRSFAYGYGSGYVQGYAPGVQVHPQLRTVQPVQVCQMVQVVDQYGRHLGWRQNCRIHY